mmetsp:Transcript_8139/g.26654  ORF Transcript_8139/g.26654 Transcript_8139/m.26654 type:complete len:214 (+) Transcript_8139:919-1560(+)
MIPPPPARVRFERVVARDEGCDDLAVVEGEFRRRSLQIADRDHADALRVVAAAWCAPRPAHENQRSSVPARISPWFAKHTPLLQLRHLEAGLLGRLARRCSLCALTDLHEASDHRQAATVLAFNEDNVAHGADAVLELNDHVRCEAWRAQAELFLSAQASAAGSGLDEVACAKRVEWTGQLRVPQGEGERVHGDGDERELGSAGHCAPGRRAH